MEKFVELMENVVTDLSNDFGQHIEFHVEYDHARQPMVSVEIPRHLFEFGIVDCVDGFDDDGNSEPEYLVYFYRNEKLVSVWNSEFAGLLLNMFHDMMSGLLDEM